MQFVSRWLRALLAVALLWPALALTMPAQAAPPAQDDAAAIANAESAAPAAIARDATVMAYDADGMPTVVLREGTNGWTCYVDWPVSPGNDPSCLDLVFDAWNAALMAGEEPAGEGTGIGYMLAGGSDPSNTDPFAMEPAAGEDWISTVPHIMLVTEAGFDAADYANEPQQDAPYIMWDDTPYEHLMVPVVPTADDLMGDVDETTANILRSAPAGVALNATIMGNPETEGDPMVVVKEGTNGWVCYPDGAVSPGNDPSCNDPMMEAFWSIGDTEGVTRVGLSYMLQGGSDASNTDPNLPAPPEGEDWVATAPHVMLVVPGGFDTAQFSTDHMSGLPYIMFADTGYQHMMIPVADLPEMEMGDMEGDAAAGASSPDLEQMMAEAIEHELGTFDLYINRDWATLDAETGADYFGVAIDGSYTERDAMMAGLQDEKLTVLPPDLGEIRVLMITPEAYMVTYPLNFNGSYDGAAFSNPRTVSSLWVKRDGKWQNIFLAEQERAAPLEATDNTAPTVMLPNGFEPEGITVGRDATAYVGSVGSGAIYQVNLATGEGSVFVPAQETQKVAGMAYDRRTDLLYVAGVEAGNGLVYDGLTGEQVAEIQFTTGGLVNDVALTDDAVFFTDSYQPVVYRLPLDPESHLPDPAASETIALTGDFENLPDGLNSNGIVASADGAKLIIAHSDLGKLYVVDTASGEAMELALDRDAQPYHDGLALDGDTLYVVDSTIDQDNVYVVALDPEWKSGEIVRTITDPTMEALSTVAIYGDALYVVNARWDAERTPETEYWLTRVKR